MFNLESRSSNHGSILILGGYGNTGRLIARLLLEETAVDIILAGRNAQKAESFAAELNRIFKGDRVTSCPVDAADPASLDRAMPGARLVIAASSTADHVEQVARAALRNHIDYLDVQYSTAKVNSLKAMEPDIVNTGCCFITDGGFHPGLPAALVRFVAPCFDRLEKANVGSVIKIDWRNLELGAGTYRELLAEIFNYQALSFKNGSWRKSSWREMLIPRMMDFGDVFGRQYTAPLFLEEMRALPEMCPGLVETGFFVGGFNWFVDWFVLPAALLGLKIWPKRSLEPLARWMEWGLKRFSKPPYGTLLKVEAEGSRGGEPARRECFVRHADGYVLTAIPVVACVKQYLDGLITEPGLHFQAHVVDPDRLIRDMQSMGVSVDSTIFPSPRIGRGARGEGDNGNTR